MFNNFIYALSLTSIKKTIAKWPVYNLIRWQLPRERDFNMERFCLYKKFCGRDSIHLVKKGAGEFYPCCKNIRG